MCVAFILGLLDKVLPWDIQQINIFIPFQDVQDAENGTEEGGLADLLGPGPSKRRTKP